VIEVKKALKGFGTLYHLMIVNLPFVIRVSGKPIKRLSLLIFHMPVEALELDEKAGVGEVAVDDSDRITLSIAATQGVPGVLDGFHVARSDEAGRADQGKMLGFHG